MKIAIVHDFLNQYGGAEKVVEMMHEMYPDAPIYTSVYLPNRMPDCFKKMDIHTSFMQKLPGLAKHYKKYFLLYPLAFHSFDLSEYDLILSSSSSYAKGIKRQKKSLHICYCHTPARFIWRYDIYMQQEKVPYIVKKAIKFASKLFLKKWDLHSNLQVDHFIANSDYIKTRINSTYSRFSTVIYPPVSIEQCSLSNKIDNYYFIVSRLNAYKKIDIAVEAFNQLNLPLIIAGNGPHKKQLESMAKNNVRFIGRISDEDLLKHYQNCKAFIFPGEEDFGITPVEAQACGRPVIAYGKGGALETVIDGETGIFFKEQTAESLIAALKRFDTIKNTFDPQKIRKNAERFSSDIFKEKYQHFVNEKIEEWKLKR